MEYDPCQNILPVDPGRAQRGIRTGRGNRDPALLQDHAAGVQTDHRGAGALVFCRNVEQLFRRNDLLKRRGYAAAAACLKIDPRAEYAAAGNDRGYSEHGGDGEGGGTFEIRDIVVSSLPLLIMYPFFQKYFDKGIMVGSVKG